MGVALGERGGGAVREEEIDDEFVHLHDGEDVWIGRGDGFARIAFDFGDNAITGQRKVRISIWASILRLLAS